MIHRFSGLSALAVVFSLAVAHSARGDELDPAVGTLLQKYCYDCHGDGSRRGKLALDEFPSLEAMRAARPTWQKVIQYVRTHTMPPPTADQPTQEERDALVTRLTRDLYDIDPANPDPGYVTIRRLNRTEYRNTIRDLVGVRFDPTIDFPQDDTGYGFDNIGDVLTLPPMLMEKYLAATDRILDEAIPSKKLEQQQRVMAAKDARPSFEMTPDRERDGWIWLSSVNEDTLTITGDSPAAAEYIVRVLAYAEYDAPPPPGKTDHEPLMLSLMLGDTVIRYLSVTADKSAPQWYEGRVGVDAGQHALRLANRRTRGPVADRIISHGHIGLEQAGRIFIKEVRVIGPVSGAVRRIDASQMHLTGSARRQRDTVGLYRTDEEAAAEIELPSAGKYLLRVRAFAEFAGDEPAKMDLRLNDHSLTVVNVSAPARMQRTEAMKALAGNAERAVPHLFELPIDLPAGKHRLAARYVNNFRDPENPDPNYRDRNLFVQHFEIVELAGETRFQPMSERMQKRFDEHRFDEAGDSAAERAAARAVLDDFANHAWRRPVANDEIDRLMRLYELARENGETARGGVKHAMKAILVSPSFLFRSETQHPPANDGKLARPIGEYDLASRLSYFLWSSTPDDELLQLAAAGRLRVNLDAQVARMLKSPKSQAFIENFAGQWLQFRNLDAAHPDPQLFEAYGDRLRDAMKMETHLFFEHIMREDRTLLDVLTADYTFVNPLLARHYNLPPPKGDGFEKVSLAGTNRRGVLTHGSVLTITSNPTRTSPVKRGKWVMENLLGSSPPAPPPDLPPLESEGKPITGTVRQQLEAHRAHRACASCHAPLDPIGFALENFDAIGAWREKDGDQPVNATTAFADGTSFTGPIELTQILAKTRKRDFFRAVTEAALTYALGRGVEPIDQPAVEEIIGRLNESNGRFSTLILGIVHSVPFQMQRSPRGNAAQTGVERMNDWPDRLTSR